MQLSVAIETLIMYIYSPGAMGMRLSSNEPLLASSLCTYGITLKKFFLYIYQEIHARKNFSQGG